MTHANTRARGQEQGRGLHASTLHDWEKYQSLACLGTTGRQEGAMCLPVVAFIHAEKQVSQNLPCAEDTLQLVTVLVGQAAGECWGPWAEGCLKDHPTHGHRVLTWESYIWRGPSAAQEWLAGGAQDNLFLCCLGRKDSLCQGQIYLGSFVLVRSFVPSFDLIYLLILELYYGQVSAALFSFFFLYFAC